MTLTNDRRIARMREVLDQRLHHVSVAVEALYHRHNVSAVLRTVDALGIHRVGLVEGHFKAVRGAARGAERWLELRHHPTPEAAVEAIRARGYRIWCADLSDDAVPPEEVPLDRPVCIWMGAELVGVSREAREACDGIVTVPMRGFAQSLNVSVAAAVTLRPIAEAARLRGADALLPPDEREALWDAWMAREEAKHLRTKKR
ncbi:MAG: RNA methyltransferase [Alphaproteobacteria bacterium]|nr:RNA methyltransferase [Alphaproteobacteria bacterium]